MNLTTLWHAVDDRLSQLDFSALADGFRRYRFALYTEREACLDGALMPRPDGFLGNTAVPCEGEFIAIWSMDADPIEAVDRLAASLVHEMFHCHQFACGETRFPSDLALLADPGDARSFEAKHAENLLLADACEQKSLSCLKRFAEIRGERRKVHPDMVEQELKVETIEGMAEYVSLRALARLNPAAFERQLAGYLQRLRAEDAQLFDLRRIGYFSGAVYFLTLDRLGLPIVNDLRSPLTAYDQNPIDAANLTADVPSFDFVALEFAALTRKRTDEIAQYTADAAYTACNAFICGYDPMSMFRVGDQLFCRHFVFLNENGQTKPIHTAVVLKLAPGSNDHVVGYYLKNA